MPFRPLGQVFESISRIVQLAGDSPQPGMVIRMSDHATIGAEKRLEEQKIFQPPP